MADTYKGDSPAKKVVRAQFWSYAIQTIGFERARKGKVAFLAGRECGDARCLSAIGLPKSIMVGVERDERAYYEALDREPFIDMRLGDMERVLCVPEFRRNLDVVLIDTCSPLTDDLARKAARIAGYCVKTGGVFGIGCMLGREKSSRLKHKISHLRKAVDRIRELHGESVHDENIREIYSSAPSQLDFDDFKVSMTDDAVRAQALEGFLMEETGKLGTGVIMSWVAQYQSSTRGGRGVPMMYVGMRVVRSANPKKMYTKAYAAFPEIQYGNIHNDPAYWEQEVIELARQTYKKSGSVTRAANMVNVSEETVLNWISEPLRRGVHGARRLMGFDMETFSVWYPEDLTDDAFLDRASQRIKDPNPLWHQSHINRICDLAGSPDSKITAEFAEVQAVEVVKNLIEQLKKERA